MHLLNLLTQLVTSQLLLNQQFIFCTFLQITSELKEIFYYSKRPIGLLFHAVSHERIKIFIANVLLISFMYFFQLSNDTSYFSINEHEIPFILALEEFYTKNEEKHARCL